MSTIKRFEEIEAWQTARELTKTIYKATSSGSFGRDHGLSDQIRRAAVSVMSNIAEGFESKTRGLFVEFLGRAKGSAGELRAQFYVASDAGYVTALEMQALQDKCEKCGSQISRLMAYLKRSNCSPGVARSNVPTMLSTVIHGEGLSKLYHRGALQQSSLLRDHLSRALRSPLSVFRRRKPETFWALKDVSLDVREGEVLGLIGRNGAGKTTLLKILSRITRPTEGWAEIHGRVGSLLEVGTGFHPELTGRENTFLSGAILGMSKAEIARKFDEIVAFAELEKFIDTAVKHYSSGMYVRLAFAVAAHLEPEILLVDEVLAVGDINFQKKCLGKMGDVARAGRTVVLVSHQLNQIRRLCHRVVWIDDGSVRQNGPTHEVVSAYESAMSRGESNGAQQHRGSGAKARFLKWEILEPKSDNPHTLTELRPTTIKFVVEASKPIRHAHHGIALRNLDQQLIWAWAADDVELPYGTSEFCYTFPMLPLRPGSYSWALSLYEDNELIDYWECLPEMSVATVSHQHRTDEWNGVLNIPSTFTVQGPR